MKTKTSKLFGYMQLLILLLLFLLFPSQSYTATMKDYCLIPPYVMAGGVVPNVMFVYEKGSAILNRAYSTTFNSATTYFGFFDPPDKYEYSGSGYFIKNNGCSGDNCFSGNILNWALMSSLDLSRRALIGFGWPDPGAGSSAGNVFTYTGTLSTRGQGNSATVNGTDPISGTAYTFCLSNATGSNPTGIKIRLGTYANCSSGTIVVNGNVDMRFTDETRIGVIQKFADKDKDYRFDADSPRFSVRRWNNGADKQADIVRDSPALTLAEQESYFRALLTAVSKAPPDDPQTPYLGDMMKEIVNYFKGSSSSYEDNDSYSQTPYNWANDPAKACRKTFAFFITTGTNLGQTSLTSTCTSCTNTAFAQNTCYASYNDLYPTDGTPPKQIISTYVVHTTFYGAGAGNESQLYCAANESDGGYFKVDDPNKFQDVIEAAISDLLKRSAAGTAASVLASGEGSGANLVQAVFYPRTPILQRGGMFDRRISWVGRLSNFWYYVDPLFQSSAIYEDNASTQVLNLTDDNKVSLYYNFSQEKTMAARSSDSNGDGIADTTISPDISFEKLNALWEAGRLLWSRDLTANPRTIKTTVGSGLIDFSTGSASTLRPYFDLTTADSDGDGYDDGDLNHAGGITDDDARILIRYVNGEDFSTYSWLRSRTVAVDLNGDGDVSDTVGGISESAKVWKLGDVLDSTPRVSSWVPLNTFDLSYSDNTYGEYLATSTYTNRGMVFAGANDGMLHAFKLGDLEVKWTGQGAYEKGRLTGTDLGKELWAFIPKNALPYLKYLTDPTYCHIFSIDLSPYIFDASIGAPGSGDISNNTKTVNDWRTILIGGMRFGGACRDATGSCNSTTGGLPDCVKTPASGNGFSSYFALDITDQSNPQLLWEFSDSQLGFTTTGPSIVRIGDDKIKNGKWFVVFGSGPTGPISTTDQQFLGRSDQNLRLFVLDLKTGNLLRTIDTGIPYAFAGSMLNATHDTDLDYQDDVLYVPYVKKAADSTWTEGGFGRLLTKENANPSNWAWSLVMDNIGPVSSSVSRLENTKLGLLWLYTGTGRYYFEQAATVDDATGQRYLIGIKEPCFSSSGFNVSCTSTVNFSDLTDVTSISNVPTESTANAASFKGWYINLDASGSYTYNEGGTSFARNYRSERVITNPIVTSSGLAFFTTFKPYNDMCLYGGKSFIWAVRYTTGGAAGALLKGVALLQVSTAAIEQLNLSTAFTDAGGRKTAALEGVPPTGTGLSLMSTPPPVKRIVHTKER